MTITQIPVDFTDAGWEKFKNEYNYLVVNPLSERGLRKDQIRRIYFINQCKISWKNQEDFYIELLNFDTRTGHRKLLLFKNMEKKDFEWENVECDEE